MVSLCLSSRLYLKEEHKAKKGRELDSTKWTLGSLRATVSQMDMNDVSLNCIFFIVTANKFMFCSLLMCRRSPSRKMVVTVVFLPVNTLTISQKEDLSVLNRCVFNIHLI